MLLAQGEAERLIAVPKKFVSAGAVTLPPGVNRELAAECDDPVERFIVDVRRSGATLHLKHREQLRARRIIVLLRLCVDGPPHTNPDGTAVGRRHLHVYRKGYEDRFAEPVDPKDFPNLSDVCSTAIDFCRYCNVTNIPTFSPTLI
ncbi:MAG TPA: hypothetical protein VN193_02640 [Candidatus Angelobacter sp.]|jgi:hypothetical protein|nr:hypothetical protein [Candidatus Angelobacter sp.]